MTDGGLGRSYRDQRCFFCRQLFIFFIIVFPDGESFCGDNGKNRGDGGKRESLLLSALVGDTNVIIDDVDLASSG